MINPRNNWTFWAGIVADPEVRDLPQGGKVVEFRLAIDYAKRSSINSDDTTAYIDGVVFDNGDRDSKWIFEQVAAGNLKKGSQVAVSAEFKTNEYEGKEDKRKNERTKVAINGIAYLPSGKKKADEDADGETSAPGSVVTKF